jgi:signal transduction histidine kinase
LAIAKQLIDAHQGTIDVTSTPDAGTRFTISISAV